MMTAVFACAAFFVSVFSAVSDVRSLRIPNSHSITIVALFFAAFLLSPDDFGRWWEHLGAAVGMFVVTYAMFVSGMIGGGDAKLGPALALWVGFKGLAAYLFYMSLAGGLLAALSLLIRKRKPFQNPQVGGWIAQVQEGRNAVPYGVAISFGAWAALLHTGFVRYVLDELLKVIH